jgi:hypothetical protein
MLSCDCGDLYAEPGDWFYDGNSSRDYSTLTTSRRKRCCSCKELIDLGAIVGRFTRSKIPGHDIEVLIWGEEGEIPMATDYMCETCYDLCLSLEELGFCVFPRDNQRELVKEYARDYGPQPKEKTA